MIEEWYEDHPSCVLFYSDKHYCILSNPYDIPINWIFYHYNISIYNNVVCGFF